MMCQGHHRVVVAGSGASEMHIGKPYLVVGWAGTLTLTNTMLEAELVCFASRAVRRLTEDRSSLTSKGLRGELRKQETGLQGRYHNK